MRNIAVILAAGVGKRAGGALPKQFCEVCGRPVIAYSVETFEQHMDIDEIVIVVSTAYKQEVEQMVQKYGWKKVKHIVAGGKERSDSSRAALTLYEGQDVNLLFHDAARPFVSPDVLTRVVEALRSHEAVATALPCVDTLFQTNGQTISSIPPRNQFMRAQTPQAFRNKLLTQAHGQAAADKLFHPTDDCGVVMRYCPDTPIYIVEGDEMTFKVTYPEDFQRMTNKLLFRTKK